MTVTCLLCYSKGMAKILIQGELSTVTLSEQDEDGDYSWTCAHGHEADSYQPMEDAVNHADIHADFSCPGSTE